ncbi:hypothetical protein BGZ49_004098, partial [Haplosporangium sp. Z 27]
TPYDPILIQEEPLKQNNHRGGASRVHPYLVQGGKTAPGQNSSLSPAKPRRVQTRGRNTGQTLDRDYAESPSLNNDVESLKDSKSEDALEDQSGPIKCRIPSCPRTFSSTGLLKSHLVSHQEDKPYWCDICSYDGMNPRPVEDSNGNVVYGGSSSKTEENVTAQPQILYYEVKRYKRNHDLLRHKREQHPPIEVKLQREAERVAARAARKARNVAQKKEKAAGPSKGKKAKTKLFAFANDVATLNTDVVAACQSHLLKCNDPSSSTSRPVPERRMDTDFATEGPQSLQQHRRYEPPNYNSVTILPPQIRTEYNIHREQFQLQVRQNAVYLGFQTPAIAVAQQQSFHMISHPSSNVAPLIFDAFNNAGPLCLEGRPEAARSHATITPIDDVIEESLSHLENEYGESKLNIINQDMPIVHAIVKSEDSYANNYSYCGEKKGEDTNLESSQPQSQKRKRRPAGPAAKKAKTMKAAAAAIATTTPRPQSSSNKGKDGKGGKGKQVANSPTKRRRKYTAVKKETNVGGNGDDDNDNDSSDNDSSDNGNDDDDDGDYRPPSERRSRGPRGKSQKRA